MIKKHEKMELITKEGIFRPRILDYSTPILETIRDLRTLTKMPRLVTREVVKSNIKMHFREKKIPTSIIGIEEAAGEAKSILGLYESFYQLKKILEEKQNKRNKTQADLLLENEIEEQINATQIRLYYFY